MTLAKTDLDAIADVAAKATPGPWSVLIDGDMPFDGQGNVLAYVGTDGGDGPCVHVAAPKSVEAADVIDDAAFIALAREAVPRLVAELRRAQDAEAMALRERNQARQQRNVYEAALERIERECEGRATRIAREALRGHEKGAAS